MAAAETDAREDALVGLFLAASPHSCSHWNTETGELFSVRSRRTAVEDAERFEDRLFDEDGWVEIPWLESDDAFTMMRDFVDALDPGRGKSALAQALAGAKPFRAFRTVLAAHPALARRYQAVEREEAVERLCQTAVALGVTLRSPELRARQEEIVADERAAQAASGQVSLGALSLGRGKPAAP